MALGRFHWRDGPANNKLNLLQAIAHLDVAGHGLVMARHGSSRLVKGWVQGGPWWSRAELGGVFWRLHSSAGTVGHSAGPCKVPVHRPIPPHHRANHTVVALVFSGAGGLVLVLVVGAAIWEHWREMR